MGGLGRKGVNMYHYYEDKEFLRKMRAESGGIMQELCHSLKEDFDIGATPFLVGSGARNLVTQNENQPVDLDYNLEIVRCGDFDDCRYLKECVRKAFNKVLYKHLWPDCQDSTSSLTARNHRYTLSGPPRYSIDVCIVRKDAQGRYHRLIHQKTGTSALDTYCWNIAPQSRELRKKADHIKQCGKWALVREEYLRIKNLYLTGNDHDHPSFVCYAEAVHNVYSKKGRW